MEGGGVRHPGPCREVTPRHHRRSRSARPAGDRVSGPGLDLVSGRASERRAGSLRLARPVRPRGRPLARERLGALQRSLGRRPVGPVARRGRGGGRPARRGGPRGRRDEGLAGRQPHVGRPLERDPLPHRGPRHGSPRGVRPQPGAEDPAPRSRRGRLAADRAAQRLGGGRVDPPGRALVRAGHQVRERAPHGRHERLLALAGGGDHAGDPDLPRRVERLERHRLQLPRRPLRHGLRGALRRHRPERCRSARPGLQHGRGGRRRDGHLRHVRSSGGSRVVAPEAPRLAARSRTRRPPCPRSRSSRAGASAIRPGCPSSCVRSRGTAIPV